MTVSAQCALGLVRVGDRDDDLDPTAARGTRVVDALDVDLGRRQTRGQIREGAPGRSSIESKSAGSSAERIFAAASARLALAASLTTRRILPRPVDSAAQTATILTPAFPRASQTLARTPGLDAALTVIWVVFAMR
jgi:hypothetical protein